MFYLYLNCILRYSLDSTIVGSKITSHNIPLNYYPPPLPLPNVHIIEVGSQGKPRMLLQ